MNPQWKVKRVRLSPQKAREQFFEICERQGWRCASCHEMRPLTRDHIRKRSQLGGDERENIQGLCWRCHDSKDNEPKSKSYYWQKLKPS